MASSMLARSAQGASFLILLQVSSRALTFIVNQVLLRYLSPKLLGVATQLELFSISTLYFSRESIRVALQRQRSSDVVHPAPATEAKFESPEVKTRGDIVGLQIAINLSYLTILLGTFLTMLFRYLYLRNADPAVLSTQYIHSSLNIYAFATILELIHEPLFATAQAKMLYSTRASAEMRATFTRCITTCVAAIWASRSGKDLGVLPFAMGQLSYATILIAGYLLSLLSVYQQQNISLLPRTPSEEESILPISLLKLASILYTQSLFKQLLTSGDAYLIALLTTLPSQGAYALASNYGGLLARILFQPIEESSRSLFARLLPSLSSLPAFTSASSSPSKANLQQAQTYLATILHLYALLSLLLTTLAPPLTQPLLHLLAGSRWSTTEAPSVLAVYCYYLPLLAVNGLLEAYVSAVATPAQLRSQSVWMVVSSVLFAVVGYVILGIGEGEARALVGVNAVVMVGRVIWSWRFVGQDLRDRGGKVGVWETLPTTQSLAGGLAGGAVLVQVIGDEDLGIRQLVVVGGTMGACGLGILWFERDFLKRCYAMLRPGKAKSKAENVNYHQET